MGSGRGPAGDKFRDSGTQETVGGSGANKVSGVLSGADCIQRMDIQDKGDGARRRQVPRSGTKDTVGGTCGYFLETIPLTRVPERIRKNIRTQMRPMKSP